MPPHQVRFSLVALLSLRALSSELEGKTCDASLTEHVGELNLLQANARRIESANLEDNKNLSRNGQRSTKSTHNSSGAASPWKGPCTEKNTIWDIGFHEGSDARSYLDAGYCVIAVEADPQLVAVGRKDFADSISSKRLRLLNMAVAPEAAPGEKSGGEMVFYRSRCKREWNSFLKTVGCRQCQPPHLINDQACWRQSVTSTHCSKFFDNYGIPHYLKLDIEGAESGCFEAMQALRAKSKKLPEFVSAEASSPEYIDYMHKLGYKRFKMVRQDSLVSDGVSNSGPWGDDAPDCRTGRSWRTYKEVRAEMVRVAGPWTKTNPGDACPIGVQDIRKAGKGTIWYDIHAGF